MIRLMSTLLGLALATAALAQEEKNVTKVAVMEFKAPAFEKGVVENLYGLLVAEIDSLEQYEVVSRDEIEAMLGFEQQKALLGCDDTSCLAEIAGALGVDKVIAGKVGRVGKTYVINLTIIDHSTAKVEKRIARTVRGEEDELIEAIVSAGRELVSAKAQTSAVARVQPETTEKTAGQQPEAEGSSGSILPIAVLAAGGVVTLVGGGLLGLSAVMYSDYQSATSNQDAEGAKGAVIASQIGGGVAGGLGVVGLVAGGLLLVLAE